MDSGKARQQECREPGEAGIEHTHIRGTTAKNRSGAVSIRGERPYWFGICRESC